MQDDPILTKEEVLERLVWSLQCDFEDLIENDYEKALKFLEWAKEKTSKGE